MRLKIRVRFELLLPPHRSQIQSFDSLFVSGEKKKERKKLLLIVIMEMERVTEFPHTHMDRRPTKRARLGWDVLPQPPKV